MKTDALNQKLIKACTDANLNKIHSLIVSGANPNQTKEYGQSIFDHIFTHACDRIERKRADIKKEAYDSVFNQIKDVVNTAVEYGWEVQKYGLDVMHQFVFMYNQKLAFDIVKFFLGLDLGDNTSKYESLLETIGTEESYRRCCENNHDYENLFYAMYEMVKAKKENRPYEGIEQYYKAEGMKIDKILYFDVNNTTVPGHTATEYNKTIGLVCKDKTLVITEGVNIFFINDIIDKEYVEIPNLFGDGIIRSTIIDISFEHKEIVKETKRYGQPTIVLSLDNGKKLKFTHNFGENPDGEVQSSFRVTE